jgi:hypothetical protein
MADIIFPRSDGAKGNYGDSVKKAELLSLDNPTSINWRRKIGGDVAKALGYESK